MSPPKEPTATVTDGRNVIGEIFTAGGKFTARDGDGNPLGSFASQDAARSAIIEKRMAERREASRNG